MCMQCYHFMPHFIPQRLRPNHAWREMRFEQLVAEFEAAYAAHVVCKKGPGGAQDAAWLEACLAGPTPEFVMFSPSMGGKGGMLVGEREMSFYRRAFQPNRRVLDIVTKARRPNLPHPCPPAGVFGVCGCRFRLEARRYEVNKGALFLLIGTALESGQQEQSWNPSGCIHLSDHPGFPLGFGCDMHCLALHASLLLAATLADR